MCYVGQYASVLVETQNLHNLTYEDINKVKDQQKQLKPSKKEMLIEHFHLPFTPFINKLCY